MEQQAKINEVVADLIHQYPDPKMHHAIGVVIIVSALTSHHETLEEVERGIDYLATTMKLLAARQMTRTATA